jgi:DNA polymerase
MAILNPRASVLKILDPLEREVGRCHQCRLSLTRKHVVFAKGNPLADLVVLGEGPGADEDLLGVPFVGPAGKLLGRALEAIGRNEKNTYVLNTVKCRACDAQDTGWWKNRAPYIDELAACRGHTWRQLDALPNKKLVLALGSTALHWLLQADPATIRIGSARRKFLSIGFGLVPGLITFHPSYLLRPENIEEKGRVYEDFKLARDFLEGKIDVTAIRLHTKADFIAGEWGGWEKPSNEAKKPEEGQRPGKPLPSQADHYISRIWIADDAGEHPGEKLEPAAPAKPQFGLKPVLVKKKSKEEPSPLFGTGDDDVPF